MEFYLQTKRLLLRKLQQADAESFYQLNLDPEVIQYTGDVSFHSVEEARLFIQNYTAYDDFGYGRWAVVFEGKVIGFCGLKFHPEDGETDLGYRLLKDYWGKGLATEASHACLLYAFSKLGLSRVIARAMPVNAGSIKVMQKLGMRFEKEVWENGEMLHQYGIEQGAYLQNFNAN